MTLKARLIAFVAGALLVSLIAGGALIVVSASRWVRAEIDADAATARQLVDERITEAAEEAESPERLAFLLQSLEATHHLRIWYRQNGEFGPGESALAWHGAAPSWLPGLLGVQPTYQEIPVTVDGRVTARVLIATDPSSEIDKVWRLIEIGFVAIGLVSASALTLVSVGLTQSLKPLARLAAGLTRIGDGDYAVRVGAAGPSEIALLGCQFDLMAAQLQHMQGRTRQLTAQLLAVAERERREIAHDLHDELGPCLLAANLDVSTLVRLNAGGKSAAVAECAKGLGSVLDRMQTLVRRMMGRLSLEPDAPVALGAAVDDLIAFWRERCPDIAWMVSPAERWAAIAPDAAAPLFRIVQEAVSNAVRHSGALAIAIECAVDDGVTMVRIADNGSGIAPGAPAGFGLSSMRERIAGLGGAFSVETAPGRGTVIAARLAADHARDPGSALNQEAA